MQHPNSTAARRTLRTVLVVADLIRTSTERPYVTASRLPSFQSQTRTGTVAVRFPALSPKKPTPFRGSGPHSPPRWRTRGRRCDMSLHPNDEDLSPGARCPPQDESDSGTSQADTISPDLGDQPSPMPPARVAHSHPPLRHTSGCVLAEPFYNNKKCGLGQRI